MTRLQPVNMSVDDAFVAAGLPPDPDVALLEPPSATDLDNWAQEAYSLDVSAATRLGFPVGNLSASYRRQTLMFGTSRWKDISRKGHTFRFGVALRAIVIVSDIKGEGSLTLPVVAAKVEIGDARASAQLVVRGYKGSKLADALPSWQTFDVDSYAHYMKAVSRIQHLILEDEQNICPELLATTILSPKLPSSGVSVGCVYGLHAVAEGSSLAHAVDKLPTADDEVVTVLREVYRAHVGAGEHTTPSVEQRHDAEEKLRGLHLSRGWFR